MSFLRTTLDKAADERNSYMRLRLLGAASALVLVITFTLGLWPFHAPRNDVNWVKDANGLSFDRYGTVFSLGAIPSEANRSAARSIEVWLRVEPWHSGSFLSFYNPETFLACSMRQSLADFELSECSSVSVRSLKKTSLYIDDFFRRRELMFIALTSGRGGHQRLCERSDQAQARNWHVRRGTFDGRLIAGDAPMHTDSWRGEIHGIAIYDSELSRGQIVAHYETWREPGSADHYSRGLHN